MAHYLGIDTGSISTKLAVVGEQGQVVAQSYLPTRGAPVSATREGLKIITTTAPNAEIAAIAITGSGRELISTVLASSIVKNEISAQAAAAVHHLNNVQTVIEIGGQDSKLILIRNGLMVDFAMNTVCAAGTGSFLDHQAKRLDLSLEAFGVLALKSTSPAQINGRCTVFAESDMIHQQQTGAPLEDLVYGLCKALVRNYLTSVAAGKDLLSPIMIQGGVAHNPGIIRAFKEELGAEIVVAPNPELTGAVGAALLARQSVTA